jgi:AcrR family transcriptional regulator
VPRLPYQEAARNLLREHVLDAVDELITRDGWVGTSLSHVAKLAGVSRQTLYNEFGSRQSIGEAFLIRRLDKLLVAAEEQLRAHPDDIEAGIAGALRLFFEMVDEPVLQTVLSPGDVGPETLKLIRVLNERAVAPLSQIICELRPAVSASDAEVFADALVQLVAAQVVAPMIDIDERINRLTRLAKVVLDR